MAYTLDRWQGHEQPTVTILAILGSLISYIYSAPPLKLKQSGWVGNYALGSSYIALPWWAGQVRLPAPATDLVSVARQSSGCMQNNPGPPYTLVMIKLCSGTTVDA